MILRPVAPEPGDPIDVTAPDARERLAALYRMPEAAWTRLNLIASVDGSVRGADGGSESLSSRADRVVLGVVRELSDIVLVGAATLRAEPALLPRSRPLAVVTATGDLGAASLPPTLPEGRLLVIGPASSEEAARRTIAAPFRHLAVEPAPDGGADATAIVAALNAVGYTRIVCEGGPRLAARLVDAGLVGELCLSTSPQLVGGALPALGPDPRSRIDLRLRCLLVDDRGGSYARWELRGG